MHASRLAFYSAIISFASTVLLTIIGGYYFPDYSHAAQFISELGARGAPHELQVRFLGFATSGVFLCIFAAAAWRVLPRSTSGSWALGGIVLFALGYVVAVFFPCDAGCRPQEPSLSQLIHNSAGLAGYLAAPAALFFLGRAARDWPDSGRLSLLVTVCAAVALAGVLTMSPESPLVGVSQRLIEGGVWLWVLACAVYIRNSRGATS